MKPYRSNTEKENCSPVSSNCVTWQGPDISCINLCKGDSVSDVIYKLATQICDFQNTANLDDLNISCILDLCPNSTEPDMTLVGVLQLIIDGVCCTQAQIQGAAYELRSASANSYSTDGYITLPPCLQYTDPTTGLLVISLPINDYAYNTAVALCSLKSEVDSQSVLISNIDTRVSVLENTPSYTPPTVTPNCTYGSVQAGVPYAMNTVLSQLDIRVCSLVSSLGSNAQLTTAASQQCSLLASQPSLSTSGTMSSLPGWNTTIGNFAQSMQNLWLTVCDMRSAIYDIKTQLGTVDCSQFILAFNPTQNAGRTTVTLSFAGLTTIPTGFVNCAALSTVTISDGVGHMFISNTFNLTSAVTAGTFTFSDISSGGLNILLPWTVTLTGCITKSNTICSKTATGTLAAATTTTTTTSLANYLWTPNIGAADLANATENKIAGNNNKVFITFTNAAGTSTTSSYSTTGAQTAVCVFGNTTPVLYFYAGDTYSPVVTSTITKGSTC